MTQGDARITKNYILANQKIYVEDFLNKNCGENKFL